jgi:hypothetical protein
MKDGAMEKKRGNLPETLTAGAAKRPWVTPLLILASTAEGTESKLSSTSESSPLFGPVT